MLLDSVYHGYPIGTLLFWLSPAEAGETTFGSVLIPGAARQDALWVVDGQQRVASLVRTLLAPGPSVDKFALFFDFDRRQIVALRAASQLRKEPSRYLPMTEVADSERLMKWVYEHLENDAGRRESAFELGKRIREYEVPTYVVQADTDEPLREIFRRINSRGKPMRALDVFHALHGARSKEHPASITELADTLGRERFGKPDQKILYRLLQLLQGKDVEDRAGTSPGALSPEAAGELFRRTSAAFARAAAFLEVDAGILHYELLPYQQPLLALGKFFDLHPVASARSRELLARWVWRGALSGTHSGDIASTRKVLDSIDSDEHASVQRLIADSKARPASLPDASRAFNFRHAQSKLEVLALLHLGPRHLATGAPITASDLFGAPTVAADAASLPRIVTSRGAGLPLADTIANRMAHPKPVRPQVLLGDILVASFMAGELEAHGFTADANQALLRADYAGFLEHRQVELARRFEHVFESRARWDDNDRPSVDTLMASVVEAD